MAAHVHGNPGKYRNLTDGISELKIDFGPEYRVYYTQRGTHLLLLLAGGDKLEEAPDDAAGIARALGDIARAKGMTQVAKDAGLSRESLYRALSVDGNPSFATVLKVDRALGVKLHAEAA